MPLTGAGNTLGIHCVGFGTAHLAFPGGPDRGGTDGAELVTSLPKSGRDSPAVSAGGLQAGADVRGPVVS